MKYLFIETFCGGSHSLFARGLKSHSSHHIDIIEMPGENFRWRMLGAALYLADKIADIDQYDGLIVSDMFNLTDFKALVGSDCPPVMVYFHENQITYPRPQGDKSVFLLGMINITSALAAEKVVFNSGMHQDAFLAAVPDFLSRAPDFIPKGIADKIKAKSSVLYPGISISQPSEIKCEKQVDPPLIVWNHRWGYDKNYKLLFKVLEEVQKKGLDFELALLGENFGKVPEEFTAAQHIFGNKIVQFGYVIGRQEYLEWLNRGAIVISTAIQENFGMSVIEAMSLGCIPLLPDRLSYPEILPPNLHNQLLYKHNIDMAEKLCRMISDISVYNEIKNQLVNDMGPFLWENVIKKYDIALEQIARSNSPYQKDNMY